MNNNYNEPNLNQNMGEQPQQIVNQQSPNISQQPISQEQNNPQPSLEHNNKPKSKKIILIIVISLIIICVGFIFANKFLNGNKSETNNSVGEKETTNNTKNTGGQHKQLNDFYNSIDTSKFDKTKFSGYLYSKTGEKVSVDSLFGDKDYFTLATGLFTIRSSYSFLEDQSDSYDGIANGQENKFPGDNLIKIMNYLGQPTNVCYITFDGTGTDVGGDMLIYYQYDNYSLNFYLADHTEWPESYGYKTLNVSQIQFNKPSEPFDASKRVGDNYKCK